MSLDLAAPVDDVDHFRGLPGGPQLVVYGDFECPYTAAAVREIGRLLQAGVGFEVAFRYFPLREIHPHAQAAAEAAEAAARQDRFWEMHDVLFRNQQRLEPADVARHAERIGLDMKRFELDAASPAVKARIERDLETGLRSGVDGTPSLFIDGRRYEGPRDAEQPRPRPRTGVAPTPSPSRRQNGLAPPPLANLCYRRYRK
jgi:protein-disulfide isomerase